MIALKLAFRNLIGAGLRTVLSSVVLSMAYVVIIWQRGFLDGWNRQALREMLNWEIGGGHYWHESYDPHDPFSLDDSHAPVPPSLFGTDSKTGPVPILITLGTIYPHGRMQSATIRGIAPTQGILELPTAALANDNPDIPVLIGTRMAKSTGLTAGDTFTIRWRDANGTFDAAEGEVVKIMKTAVSSVDAGQLWLPIEKLREMMGLPGQATIVVKPVGTPEATAPGWVYRDKEFLSGDVTEVVRSKKVSGYILHAIMLSLALMAIFDTQVLAVFRRRREIGTLVAMGMTRWSVVRLFTVEGAMHGILGAALAIAYGIPFLAWQASHGLAMPEAVDSYGLTVGERIYPVYSLGLITGTILIVMTAVTIVSFLPSRKIGRMNPTDAIRGKLS